MNRAFSVVAAALAIVLQCSTVALAQEPPPEPVAPAAPAAIDDGGAAEPAAQEPAEPAEPKDPSAPTVGASLDRTEAHVGDRLTLTVTAIARGAAADAIRLVTRELGKFEILDESQTDQDLGDGRRSRRVVLQIAAYELGVIEVPKLTVEYKSASGETRTVKTAPIAVRIAELVDDPKAEMQPLARPRDVLVEDRRWIQGLIAAGVLVGLGLAALVVRAIARRRRRRAKLAPPAPKRPAHEVALGRLAELRAAGRFSDDDYRPFHFAVSEIVRGYLGERFGFDSLELTTTELLDELRPLAHDAEPDIAAFMEECDLVKFAKAPSSDAAALRLLDAAEALVRRLIEVPETPAAPPSTPAAPPSTPASGAAHG